MLFDDSYIDNLPDEPAEALIRICDTFFEFDQRYQAGPEKVGQWANYLKAVALLNGWLAENGDLVNSKPFNEFASSASASIQAITKHFAAVRNRAIVFFQKTKVEIAQASYQARLRSGFAYRFEEGDIQRIQALLDELRGVLRDTESLEESHKMRLLAKLEKLQSELHKTVSDLDRFWGFFVEACVVLRKIGESAKPIVDRVNEILQIVGRVQATAEGIPINSLPQLPQSTEIVPPPND